MKILCTVYYCMYTKNTDALPRYSPLFATKKGARAHAEQLVRQGYWGAIERHSEWKQDYENDFAYIDMEDTKEQTIEMLGYF